MYLVTAEEMREMDRMTIEEFGIPGRVLMENAGRGATRMLMEEFGNLAGKKIGVMAGRGNNGGDGHVIARYLSEYGFDVGVWLLGTADQVRGDAKANLDLLPGLDIPLVEMPDEAAFESDRAALAEIDLWVDAVLGTGLKSDVRGYFGTIIDFINEQKKPVFAVDIPSGLDSDTGMPHGKCVRAAATATFAYAKTGHLQYPGAEYTGKLRVIDIGIPERIANRIGPKQWLMTPESVRTEFSPRPPAAHKGNNGHLLVLAGSPGKTGAAAMAALSALRTGTGLVTLGVPAALNPVLETLVLEGMTVPLPDDCSGFLRESAFETIMGLLSDKKCLALGPGIGTPDETRKLVHRVLKACRVPVVIDADGLNCLAGDTELLKISDIPIVLTPHPGEMARLAGMTTREIQQDRIGCARNFATEHNVHLVLKGAGTVIAHPNGDVFVNPTGNPGMASGGMGDVLTGMVAGLIAQGYPVDTAARMGVFLHGAAADELAEKSGPFGYLAGEIMNAIPNQIGILSEKERNFPVCVPERTF